MSIFNFRQKLKKKSICSFGIGCWFRWARYICQIFQCWTCKKNPFKMGQNIFWKSILIFLLFFKIFFFIILTRYLRMNVIIISWKPRGMKYRDFPTIIILPYCAFVSNPAVDVEVWRKKWNSRMTTRHNILCAKSWPVLYQKRNRKNT